jgi:Protein of unknown function (DUF1552)
MMKRTVDMYRRRMLVGAGGVVIGLPLLETFMPRRAWAQNKTVFTMLMQQQNGVIQGTAGDPQIFWPAAMGPLSAATMAGADADKATSELKDYADKLLMIRGINFPFGNPVGCGHSSGCNQTITAAKMQGRTNRSRPVSESVDMRIAALVQMGKEPLTLYAGRKAGYLDDAFSYGAGGSVRSGENNPLNAFNRLFGGMPPATQPPAGTPTQPPAGQGQAEMQKLALRRKSVNDLLRSQIQSLMVRKELSKNDRDRLNIHLQSIRDLEVGMGQVLGPPPSAGDLMARLTAVNGTHTANDKMEAVVRLQLEVIALAFASGRNKVATLQIGEGNDHTKYMVNGVLAPPFHFVSHRVLSDGGSGTRITNAVELHHGIDRIHARMFKHFLDVMTQHKLPDGRPLLDDSMSVWLNSNANGPPHSVSNVPHIVAGSGGGFLKQGQHIAAGGVTNNLFLNTIITGAIGGKSAPAPVTDFGDPGLRKEILPAMLA